MSTAVEEIRIPAPEFRGAALQLGACQDLEVCLDGAAGTGKTLAALFKIHIMLLTYPGTRALVARKSNTDLAGSAMATYRDDILDPNEGVIYFGGNRVKPAGFMYPNGSFLAVNGLDKPGKVRSWEFSIAYINEASECTIEDIEFVRSRLRQGKTPYPQLIMDTNPDAPEHWLNQRMIEGRTTRLISAHEDNPRYYDAKLHDWTPAGREYIFGTLGGLTGVRLARYRYGLWTAAEGSVYQDSFDRTRNVIDRVEIPQSYPRYLVVDFGFTHPFVCQWWAIDPDGRAICYREIYKTQVLVEDHAKEIKRLSRWGEKGGDPYPREVIADHDSEDRKTFERHTGLSTIPAHKTVRDGIQAVSSRLRAAGDSKPRIMFFRDALVETDQALAKAKRPKSTIEEFGSYVWKKNSAGQTEEPVKENDHGLDCVRYLTARLDLQPSGVSYFPNIWR